MTARGVAAVPGPRHGDADTMTWPALAWEAEQGAYAAGYEQAKADAGRVVPFDEAKRLLGIFFDAGFNDGKAAGQEALREAAADVLAATHQCPTCGGDGS